MMTPTLADLSYVVLLGILLDVVGFVALAIVIGMQARQIRRDTHRLVTATALMVHQEANRILRSDRP